MFQYSCLKINYAVEKLFHENENIHKLLLLLNNNKTLILLCEARVLGAMTVVNMCVYDG